MSGNLSEKFKLEPGTIYVINKFEPSNNSLEYLVKTSNNEIIQDRIVLPELSSLPTISQQDLERLLNKILKITSEKGHTIDHEHPVTVQWEHTDNGIKLSISHTQKPTPVGDLKSQHGHGGDLIHDIFKELKIPCDFNGEPGKVTLVLPSKPTQTLRPSSASPHSRSR